MSIQFFECQLISMYFRVLLKVYFCEIRFALKILVNCVFARFVPYCVPFFRYLCTALYRRVHRVDDVFKRFAGVFFSFVYLCTLFVPVKVQRNTNKPQAAHLSAFIRVSFVCTTVYRSGKHTQRRSTEPHNAQKKLTRIIKHQYNTSRSESVQSLQRYRRASSPPHKENRFFY